MAYYRRYRGCARTHGITQNEMLTRRVRLWLRRLARRILHHKDPAPRIARGIAAGFFAAAVPLPGLQIPLSLLAAALVRGNKAVSIFPQFLANAATMLPMIYLEFLIGAALWPAHAEDAQHAAQVVKQAMDAFTWAAPFASLEHFFLALGELGFDAGGPLVLGIAVLGTGMAALSYPLAIIAVWTWRARKRAERIARGLGPRKRRPFNIEGCGAALAGAEAMAHYALHPERFVQADSVKLLINGEQTFPEMLAAIDGARQTVDLETYILVADRTGKRFSDALARAATRGVRVRLMYDAVGALGLSNAFVENLLAAGVRVAVYHPLLVFRPDWAINRRDHRKILIADGRVSFTGGLNISDDYASKAAEGRAWRDTHARLEGKQPAAELLELFELAWEKAHKLEPGGPKHRSIRQMVTALLPALKRTSTVREAGGPSTGIQVNVIGNREFRQRRRIRAAYLHAIRQARDYILIENGFFLPDRGIRRALAHAVERGVRVAVAVSRTTDPKIGAVAGRVLYSELLAAGVRIYEWPEPMLHAKTAVIDGAWSVVGSYNINSRSLFHDLEAVVVIVDPAFAKDLCAQTLKDLEHCHEVTQDEHESRPWPQMLLESSAYLLRYWL